MKLQTLCVKFQIQIIFKIIIGILSCSPFLLVFCNFLKIPTRVNYLHKTIPDTLISHKLKKNLARVSTDLVVSIICNYLIIKLLINDLLYSSYTQRGFKKITENAIKCVFLNSCSVFITCIVS